MARARIKGGEKPSVAVGCLENNNKPNRLGWIKYYTLRGKAYDVLSLVKLKHSSSPTSILDPPQPHTLGGRLWQQEEAEEN